MIGVRPGTSQECTVWWPGLIWALAQHIRSVAIATSPMLCKDSSATNERGSLSRWRSIAERPGTSMPRGYAKMLQQGAGEVLRLILLPEGIDGPILHFEAAKRRAAGIVG
jgi:hypothetical protein